jgi:hypothetical protein
MYKLPWRGIRGVMAVTLSNFSNLLQSLEPERTLLDVTKYLLSTRFYH